MTATIYVCTDSWGGTLWTTKRKYREFIVKQRNRNSTSEYNLVMTMDIPSVVPTATDEYCLWTRQGMTVHATIDDAINGLLT